MDRVFEQVLCQRKIYICFRVFARIEKRDRLSKEELSAIEEQIRNQRFQKKRERRALEKVERVQLFKILTM